MAPVIGSEGRSQVILRMHSISGIAIRVSAAASLLLAVVMNAAAAPPRPDADLTQLIDKAVGKTACMGMAIGVEKNGKRAARFFGTIGNGKRPDADTEFRIGSITKTFTAALLAWEDQRGAMHLGDPLQAYAPPGTAVPAY